ncbi:hypothetical protein HFO02_34040 [Rhizobium laguerreae]|uniref:hypothetical protein n=1 Tax=Rhizobium laguerreae TaxID=1076926 RepID=UPI001C9135D4|nr:hypothetical protein [Rhizobium laguerreae]MBY3328522.1 hypothetical protein [Rhizobium laguerreae]
MSLIAEFVGSGIRALDLLTVLGTSERGLRAWLRSRNTVLTARCFTARNNVVQRQNYYDLGQENFTQTTLRATAEGKPFRLWISGSGGSGKSTLAFEIARRASERRLFLPCVLNYSWTGDLYAYIATMLTPSNSGETVTAAIARKLVQSGQIGLVIDGLSEMQQGTSTDIMLEIRQGRINHFIITSRSLCPETLEINRLELAKLNEAQLEALVNGYIDNPADRKKALFDLKGFAHGDGLNTLFARLAIDQWKRTKSLPESTLDLTQQFLLSLLPSNSSSPGDSDFLRAAKIAGFACTEGNFAPHDISDEYLRGSLEEASSRNVFLTKSGETLAGHKMLSLLIDYGIIETTTTRLGRRLDFVHHPIAENLAAAYVADLPDTGRVAILNEIRKSKTASRNFLDALALLGHTVPPDNARSDS